MVIQEGRAGEGIYRKARRGTERGGRDGWAEQGPLALSPARSLSLRVCVCAHGHPCVSEVRLMSLSHSYPQRSQALCGGLEEPEGETLSDPFLSSSRPSLSLSGCEPGLPGGW